MQDVQDKEGREKTGWQDGQDRILTGRLISSHPVHPSILLFFFFLYCTLPEAVCVVHDLLFRFSFPIRHILHILFHPVFYIAPQQNELCNGLNVSCR
jgi:hypothetical protein